MTVSTLARAWLRHITGSVARNTLRGYSRVVDAYLTSSPLGAMRATDVRSQHVRDFLLNQRRAGWAPGFVRLMQSVVALTFEHGVGLEIIPANPAVRLWRRCPPELCIPFEPERFTPPAGAATATLTHIALIHPALARLVMTYADTGCRRNEALGLQAQDLSLADHTITVARQWHGKGEVGRPKSRRPRTVDVSERLEAALVEAISESDAIARRLGRPPEPRWIFRSTRTGLPWHPTYVNHVLRDASEAVCRQRVTPHGIRHAVATKLLHDGVSLAYVQELLGHSHISTTMRYIARRGIRQRSAVNGLHGA